MTALLRRLLTDPWPTVRTSPHPTPAEVAALVEAASERCTRRGAA